MTLIYQYENVRFQSYTKYDFEILTKLLNQDPNRPNQTKPYLTRPTLTQSYPTRPNQTQPDPTRPNQTQPDPNRPKQTQTKINYLL